MSRADLNVQCTRCRNKHKESQRVSKARRLERGHVIQMSDVVCPRCGCTSYYDLTPQVAWCWASGLIEFGDAAPKLSPAGGGSIEIARGPKAFLRGALEVVARHGKGASAGSLLVPGVPEADGQRAKGDALASWLGWCSKTNKSASRNGVTFSAEVAHAA